MTLLKSENGGWEFYTNGRVNAFFSWAKGQGLPRPPFTAAGQPAYGYPEGVGGTGFGDSESASDPVLDPTETMKIGYTQGEIDTMRIRSGFVGNVLGFGLRRPFEGTMKASAYISIWSVVESFGRRKYYVNNPDVREGWLKLEGPWGSFLGGKALTLFNRGAGEADFLYLHGYGLGYPGSIGVSGPAAGLIGFGILGPTFSAGLVYASPPIAGIQLSAGIYDPAQLTGSRFERTKAVRPEFELTVDEPLGDLGKVHLYFNGTMQKLYVSQQPDAVVTNGAGTFGGSETAKGIGYGGRVEVGPAHLAAGGHRGLGLGLDFALQPSPQTYNGISQLRDSDGYYVIGQVSVGKFDINAGFGRTRIKPLELDLVAATDSDYPAFSIIHTQTGYAGAVVFHPMDWLHFDVDVMHADFKWTLGDRQRITFVNAGTTLTW